MKVRDELTEVIEYECFFSGIERATDENIVEFNDDSEEVPEEVLEKMYMVEDYV